MSCFILFLIFWFYFLTNLYIGPDEAPEETTRKLQTLIEHYLQQNPTRPYHPRLMHAALPFLAIGLSLEDAYRCFTSFLKIFVPKFFTEDKKVLQYPIYNISFFLLFPFPPLLFLFFCYSLILNISKADLLRLLILYHDPALCYYMDQRGVSPMSYVHDWVRNPSLPLPSFLFFCFSINKF